MSYDIPYEPSDGILFELLSDRSKRLVKYFLPKTAQQLLDETD